MRRPRLSHLDARDRPAMVDVGAKEVTARSAQAEARIRLPPAVARALRASGHRTRKGPVFDTAILAGVMAAKRTHELIPFCHPLPIENCQIEIAQRNAGVIVVRCRVSVHHRTGVEMEALTACAAAALVLLQPLLEIDPCTSIEGLTLWRKTGGRSGTWWRQEDGGMRNEGRSSLPR
jgi:cyclic pyranopterin monophosphate synthase